MKVVFDIDDTLFDCSTATEELIREYYPGYSKDLAKTYNFNKSLTDELKLKLGIDPADRNNGCCAPPEAFFDVSTSVELYKRERMYEGVGEFLRDLSKKCEVVIHTAADSIEVAAYKIEQANNMFRDYNIEGVITISVLNDIEREVVNFGTKTRSIVKKSRKHGSKQILACDILVEDCLKNIAAIAPGTLAVLVDQPHNQEEFNPEYSEVFNNSNVRRVYSPQEMFDVVNEWVDKYSEVSANAKS